MKKFRIIGLVAAMALLVASCGKEWLEEYQPDPTRPIDVSIAVLLPSAQAFYGMAQGDVVPRLTGIFMQQMTGADRQSLAHNRYAQIGENDFNTPWGDNGYAGGMKDLTIIIQKAQEDGALHYSGLSKIMLAQYLGLFTDIWGDLPYAQAYLESENLNPTYQTQESIYQTILSLLSEGIAECQGESTYGPGIDDYYFGGNMDLWAKYGYSLRARYLNHLSKRPQYNPGDVLAAVAQGFQTTTENAMQPYGDSRNSSNPWYQFTAEDRLGYIEQRGYMYDEIMIPNNDPRLPFYRSEDLFLIPSWGAINAPLPIITYFELKFIEAEATSRQGGNARPALEAAIIANMQLVGVAQADIDAYIAALPGTTNLELIMTEKYVAMFTHYETWTDWRRTGIPAIEVFPDANLPEIPRRLPYPESERLYNDNFIDLGFPTNFLQRMWWDQ